MIILPAIILVVLFGFLFSIDYDLHHIHGLLEEREKEHTKLSANVVEAGRPDFW